MIGHLFEKQKTVYRGIYRGVVADNVDPKKFGRVRVRVYGIMQSVDVPTASLPWAAPASPLSNGSNVGYGSLWIPQIDSEVFVFFEDGNHMSPIYFAEAPNGVKGVPEFSATNYPSRIGFKLSNNLEFYIDKSTNDVKVTHPSGTTITIDNAGKVKITTIENFEVESAGEIKLHSTGKLDIEVGDETDIELLGQANIIAHDDVSVQASADVALVASGNVTISGSTVNINP